MKKLLLSACCIVFFSASACAAKIDKASLANWAKSAPVAGYSFGGVEETDPGVYMAIWMNSKEEMIGLHVQPASEFKKMDVVLNKKKPVAFSYKGVPALYSDALAPMANMAMSYESAGKTLTLSNMGQARALTKDEMVKILDGMGIDKLVK